jgi:hypothetical protein
VGRTLLSDLCAANMQSSFSGRVSPKGSIESKIKSVGQECPTHTSLASSGTLLDPEPFIVFRL